MPLGRCARKHVEAAATLRLITMLCTPPLYPAADNALVSFFNGFYW
jgi:hypothetical protein